MKMVNDAIKQTDVTHGPVLLEGEQGVGKEFVARLLHLRSRRRPTAFETFFPPAMPTDLVTEELFGEQARKLKQAAGGTLLLKEIWRFPLAVQQRLAEAIGRLRTDDRTPLEIHDVWLMMSSRISLEEARTEGLVSQALAKPPLSTWQGVRRILLPPLRRRPADIPLLVEAFNKEITSELHRKPLDFSPRVMDRFTRYSWPGNISELKAVVFRLLTTMRKNRVTEQDLAGLLPLVEDDVQLGRFSLEDLVRAKLQAFLDRVRGYHVEDLHGHVLSQVERPLIELVLEQTGGNQLQAARILGINRNTLRKKIRSLDIRLPR